MNIYKKNILIWKDGEFLISFLVILACLFLSVVFPVDRDSLAQLITKNVFFLVVVPALYIKLIIRKDLSSFGFNIKNKKSGIFWGIFSLMALLSLYYLLFNYTDLPKKYILPKNVVSQFSFFLLYELLMINILFFTHEFFYRGFVLFLFSKKIGYWSVFVQAAIFILASFLGNGFFWQFSAPIVLSLTNGFLSYKSKSFIYPYATSLLFIIIMNSYIIYSINK